MNTEFTPEAIKKLREGLGLTQEELAEKLNRERHTVNRWENGSSRPARTAVLGLKKLIENQSGE